MSSAKRKREDGNFRRRDGGGRFWHPTGKASMFGVHGEPDVKLNADQLRAYELAGRSEPAIMAAKNVLIGLVLRGGLVVRNLDTGAETSFTEMYGAFVRRS